jgi:hypothetical protein
VTVKSLTPKSDKTAADKSTAGKSDKSGTSAKKKAAGGAHAVA